MRLGRRAGFGAVAYAFAVTALGTTIPTPLYGIYQEQFGFSELTITLIYGTYAAGVIAGLLLFGSLSDQIGRRRTLLPGLALSAASAVVFLLAQGLAPLFLGRVLSGLSIGVFTGTATAALIDFAGPGGSGRATLASTLANMGGLGLGPLIAGALAEWATEPLRLPFWVDLALLVPAALAIWAIPEPVERTGRLRIRPQTLSVPAEMRPTFVRAALAGFAGFAVLGTFSGASPAFLAQVLDETNHFVIGLIVFIVFASSTAGQLLVGPLGEGRSLRLGCALMVLGLITIFAAMLAESLGLLFAGGVLAGCGQGLSFRAGLAAVNAAAPAERRAEVASSFFVVAFVALSLPVIGEGILAELTTLRTAGLVFSALVAGVAAAALALLARQPGSGPASG
jgi:MFS family permease